MTEHVGVDGACSLCGGTHYGSGRQCPYRCERCGYKTGECAALPCPRDARWEAIKSYLDKRRSSMVDKKQADIGELALAIAGLGETVKLTANGAAVVGIDRRRSDAGDLELNLVTEAAPAAPAAPADAPVVPIPEAAMAEAGHEPRDQAPELPLTDDVDAADDLAERRQNDPGTLTDEERAELKRIEDLGGATERRVDDSSPGQDDPAKGTTEPL